MLHACKMPLPQPTLCHVEFYRLIRFYVFVSTTHQELSQRQWRNMKVYNDSGTSLTAQRQTSEIYIFLVKF